MSSVEVTSLPPADDLLLQQLDSSFNRKCSYHKVKTEWQLPSHLADFEVEKWHDNESRALQQCLNDVKSKLSAIDIISWQNHTQTMHSGGDIARYMRSQLDAELCTQAWCKFYEILGTFPNLTQSCNEIGLNTVHLCEAPGAFIASMNHYLTNRGRRRDWKWLATTLNPYYEGNSLSAMIDDDRFIDGTHDNWYFGEDNTGDIMSINNLHGLLTRCAELGMTNVHLVTADGSVDCANEPAEQEVKVAPLHYAEVITALHLLAPGGSTVVKMFTLLSHSSICVMYLLCCLFEQVSIFKPVTSKPGNSEVYVVAECYLSASHHLLSELKSRIGSNCVSNPLFHLEDLPESFLSQHREYCRRFSRWQMETIESNLLCFEESLSHRQRKNLKLRKNFYVKAFIERFQVEPIDLSNWLVVKPTDNQKSHRQQSAAVIEYSNKRRYEGSLVDRQTKVNLSWEEKVIDMDYLDTSTVQLVSTCKGRFPLQEDEATNWQMVTGKPLEAVRSSRFCDKLLLLHYSEFLQNEQAGNGVTFSSPETNFILTKTSFVDILNTVLLEAADASYSVSSLRVFNADTLPVTIDDTIQTNFGDLRIIQHSQSEDDDLCRNPVPAGSIPCTNVPSDTMLCTSVPSSRLVNCDVACVLSVEPLVQLLAALQCMQEHCHCLISVGPMLTRRNACILFLLYCCFEKVITYKDGRLSVLFLAGFGFRRCSSSLMRYIQRVEEFISRNISSSNQLLSLVPMNYLCERRFHELVCRINNDFIMLRTNHLLSQQKCLLSGYKKTCSDLMANNSNENIAD